MKMYKMREMSHCHFLSNFIFFCTIVILKKWYSGIALAFAQYFFNIPCKFMNSFQVV
jgi:hypothetical protein